MPKISIKEVTKVVHDDNYYYEKKDELKNDISNDVLNISKEVSLFKDSITSMSTGNMYTMLTLLKAFNTFKGMKIEKEDILLDYSNVGNYDDFFDRVINKFHDTFDDSYSEIETLMEDISFSINQLAIFSAKNVLLEVGPTISIKDILDIGKRNPEFYETLDFTHEEFTNEFDNMAEKIRIQDANKDRALAIIKNDKKSQFSRLLKSNSGININQLAEVINCIGYKPDLRGMVVPTPIDTSFFRGITKVQDYYTDALGARKALITSKLQVRQSGYLNRKISILTQDVKIDPDIKDCGTKQYMPLKITSEDMFKLLIGRYHNTTNGEEIIDKEDTYLIGTTIQLRSPITCALGGDHICRKCYGKLSKVNSKLNVGTLANLIFTEPMTQKLLSTKHLLKVKVDIKWDDVFFKYFHIDSNIIIPIDNELEIYIDEEDIIINENYNTNRYRTKRFYVIDEDERVYLDSPVPLVIQDNEINDIENYFDINEEAYKFSLENLYGADYLFSVVIKNTGIADPLLEMKDGLDKNYKMNKIHEQNIYSYFQDMIELLIKSNTYVTSVHIEVILRCMTKFKDRAILKDEDINITEIDFNNSCEDKVLRKYYTMYSINDAIYHSESPVKALMYQQVVKQLTTDSFNNLFNKRDESEFDRLFLNDDFN